MMSDETSARKWTNQLEPQKFQIPSLTHSLSSRYVRVHSPHNKDAKVGEKVQ
jgi:hypothetical protein